jgi:hypothetical protein
MVPIQAVKAIGATVANRWVADRGGAAPKVSGRAVVANDEAVPITYIDANRQEI